MDWGMNLLRRLDESTLEILAGLICGDSPDAPAYRTGNELSKFFSRAGVSRLRHDGSTRLKWTLYALCACDGTELELVIRRLVHPKEYGGSGAQVNAAVEAVNRALAIEGYQVVVDNLEPRIVTGDPQMAESVSERVLEPIPAPDFSALGLDQPLAEVLDARWNETERCVDGEAYLAGVVMMGSLLEGLLLAVAVRFPEKANRSSSAPRDRKTGKTRPIPNWTLSELIDVAHEAGWIDLDVKRFSHALRQFRNLVHPWQQIACRAAPDRDTCEISWLVVQAAVDDLASTLLDRRSSNSA